MKLTFTILIVSLVLGCTTAHIPNDSTRYDGQSWWMDRERRDDVLKRADKILAITQNPSADDRDALLAEAESLINVLFWVLDKRYAPALLLRTKLLCQQKQHEEAILTFIKARDTAFYGIDQWEPEKRERLIAALAEYRFALGLELGVQAMHLHSDKAHPMAVLLFTGMDKGEDHIPGALQHLAWASIHCQSKNERDSAKLNLETLQGFLNEQYDFRVDIDADKVSITKK